MENILNELYWWEELSTADTQHSNNNGNSNGENNIDDLIKKLEEIRQLTDRVDEKLNY